MKGEIKQHILEFHRRLARDPNHRYRSWEHCFLHFKQRSKFTTAKHLETASLHLAFYLASWGMYRGSSALLWKDYRVHEPAVKKLLDPKYGSLWDLDLCNLSGETAVVALIEKLFCELRGVYEAQITEVDGMPETFSASDILVTKVMLGTICCTPACDRYFISGYRHSGLRYSCFNKNFLNRTLEFYRNHIKEFKESHDAIFKCSSISYPPMKLIDMYFWQVGFSNSSVAEFNHSSDAA